MTVTPRSTESKARVKWSGASVAADTVGGSVQHKGRGVLALRSVFVFVDALPPTVEGERGPDEVVAVMPQPEHDRLVIYMKSGADENTLARELSYAVTTHASEEWLYVGRVFDAA